MATGGAERNVEGDDFRQTCGLCMESYRGRQPKLLPCFHTFCLPCLTTLADTAATSANTRQKESSTDNKKQEITGAADEISGGTGGDEGDGGDSSGGLRDAANGQGDTGEVIMFLCPTCRSPVRVPEGGVKNLQANFYLHEADDSSRSVSCELCEDEDQKQDATHACEECRVKLCRSCRRIHDRFPGAGSHHLNPLCQPTDQSVVLQEKMCLYHPDQKLSFFCPTCDVCVCFHCKLTSHNSHDLVDLTAAARQVKLEAKGLQIKANQQIQVTASLLDRLDGDEQQLLFKTQNLRREVSSRRDTAVAWLTQAHDKVLQDIRNKEQAILRDIQAERSSANATVEALSGLCARATHMAASGLDIFPWKSELQSALLKDDVLEQHRKRTALDQPVADFTCEANSLLLDPNLMEEYIGRVQSGKPDPSDTPPLLSVRDIARQVDSLKAEAAQQTADLKTEVAQQTADLKTEVDSLRQDLTKSFKEAKDISTRTDELKSEIDKMRTAVCFHARQGPSGTTETVTPKCKIIFGDVRFNTGDGYDPGTGVFTAPIEGTYIFMASVGNQNGTEIIYAYIVVNRKDYARAHGSPQSSGTCHVAVKLKTGDEAYVRAGTENHNVFYTSDTFFSGALVQV